MSDEGAAADLLEDRPDLADALEAVLAVDRERDTWTFDDVPVESGPFGELVGSGVVESVGDEYRLANPAAARAALEIDEGGADRGTTTPEISVSSVSLPSMDRTTALVVGAALAFVALVRVHPIRSIYRDGNVVLSGNDPYHYRYWVEQVVAAGGGVFDLSSLATLPDAVREGEPLMVATLWWLAQLLGGSQAAVDTVLAWFPVVSAVVTAAIVYLIAVSVTDDRRIGLAAVLVFALIPGHAMRTSLGYADHHAFDYPWLAATGLLLVFLAPADRGDLRDATTWLLGGALGIAVAGQVLAWEAGPLLVVPIGVVVLAKSLADVHAGRSPLLESVPVFGGLAIATVLVGAVHTVVGWHTTLVAAAPALLFVGSAGVVALAEAVHRTTGDVRHLAVGTVVGSIGTLIAFRTLAPDLWLAAVERLDQLFRDDSIAETHGLFSPDSFGFLFLFGFTLVLALPVMAWAVSRVREDDRWLVPTVYAWYFFGLATVQVRFVGELAAFAAVFAGVGLVWVAAWIDAAGPFDDPVRRFTIRDRAQIGTLVLLFLLVTSLGIVQVPVKTSQITVEDGTYQSAAFIADRSAELGEEYPQNRVFSEWGRNRVYNYYVNGESRSYWYAQNNFEDFLFSRDLDAWYDRLSDRPIGYVVLPTSLDAPDESVHSRLATSYGSRNGNVDGTGHYRALYLPPDRSNVVISLVPGAEIAGTAPANSTVTVATDVSIPRADFTYERRTVANATGHYEVRVAQPGTYEIQAGNETERVAVSEEAVRDGTRVSASDVPDDEA